MPKLLTRSDAVSSLLSSRLDELGLTAEDFAQRIQGGRSNFAAQLLSGWQKVPFCAIDLIAYYLELDPALLRRLMVETYLGAVVQRPIDQMDEPLVCPVDQPIVPDVGEMIDPREMLILPKLRVRHFLAQHLDGFTLDDAVAGLITGLSEATIVLCMLEQHGLISRISDPPEPSPRWRLEPDGEALVARAVHDSLVRPSAFSLLVSFLDHVAAVNRRDELPLYVSDVTVIGETLTQEEIPHLEVAITLSVRHANPDLRSQRLIESFMRGWDSFLDLGHGLSFDECCSFWPIKELQEAITDRGLPVAIRWRLDEDRPPLDY